LSEKEKNLGKILKFDKNGEKMNLPISYHPRHFDQFIAYKNEVFSMTLLYLWIYK
jgi:hypothetical protein